MSPTRFRCANSLSTRAQSFYFSTSLCSLYCSILHARIPHCVCVHSTRVVFHPSKVKIRVRVPMDALFLPLLGRKQNFACGLLAQRRKSCEKIARKKCSHRGDRTHDHKIKSLALYH